jgi:hypothetical protein
VLYNKLQQSGNQKHGVLLGKNNKETHVIVTVIIENVNTFTYLISGRERYRSQAHEFYFTDSDTFKLYT